VKDGSVLGRVTLTLLLVAAACGQSPQSGTAIDPPGPPEVERAAVQRHARQFSEELSGRRAGSQQEEIAATYILGHLQQAGYVARLDAVPVANLVRSTNVIAVPPSGEEPSVLVAVAYDSARGRPGEGLAIAVFLEVARALRVAEGRHSVGFVALGAERTGVSGAHLGVRRLAEFLQEENQDPFVVLIDDLSSAAPFHAEGPGAGAFSSYEGDTSAKVTSPRKTLPAGSQSRAALDILTDAGLEAAIVGGGSEVVGGVLLSFLSKQEG
jgi:hypothetical protein